STLRKRVPHAHTYATRSYPSPSRIGGPDVKSNSQSARPLPQFGHCSVNAPSMRRTAGYAVLSATSRPTSNSRDLALLATPFIPLLLVLTCYMPPVHATCYSSRTVKPLLFAMATL